MATTKQKRVQLPKLPSLASASRPAGSGGFTGVRVPRPRRTQRSQRPYPKPPADWVNPLGEWVIYWYLTQVKGWKKIGQGSPPIPGKSFYYQVRVKALGVFVNTSETRIDFLIPQGRGGGAGYQAIAIDPYTEFTHKDPQLDRLKKVVLLQQEKILLIWIEGARLEAGNTEVIEEALRGVDSSARKNGA